MAKILLPYFCNVKVGFARLFRRMKMNHYIKKNHLKRVFYFIIITVIQNEYKHQLDHYNNHEFTDFNFTLFNPEIKLKHEKILEQSVFLFFSKPFELQEFHI